MHWSWQEGVWFFSGLKCQFCWSLSFLWCPSWWNCLYQKILNHEFSTYSKTCCLALVLPPMSICPDLRRKYFYCTGSLGSACIIFQRQPIEVHKSSSVCHKMPPCHHPYFSSLFQICQSCQLAHSICCMPEGKQPTKAHQEQEGSFVSSCLLSWQFCLCQPICCQHSKQIAMQSQETIPPQSVSWW